MRSLSVAVKIGTEARDGVDKENASKNQPKKQIPLRLSATLFQELSRWADDDFRSLNGQIEYLLSECVNRRKGGNK